MTNRRRLLYGSLPLGMIPFSAMNIRRTVHVEHPNTFAASLIVYFFSFSESALPGGFATTPCRFAFISAHCRCNTSDFFITFFTNFQKVNWPCRTSSCSGQQKTIFRAAAKDRAVPVRSKRHVERPNICVLLSMKIFSANWPGAGRVSAWPSMLRKVESFWALAVLDGPGASTSAHCFSDPAIRQFPVIRSIRWRPAIANVHGELRSLFLVISASPIDRPQRRLAL
jgi:hypothetical protein